MRMKNIKIKYLLILLVIISIGFALISTTLNIQGQGHISPMRQDVHFSNGN